MSLDSPACRRAFGFYADLARRFSPGGKQAVDTTRDTYFAGRAAMILWSPFLLDAMAGLGGGRAQLPALGVRGGPRCARRCAAARRAGGARARRLDPNGGSPAAAAATAQRAVEELCRESG